MSGVTAESLRAIICSKSAISLQGGSVDAKGHVEGVAPTNHSFSQKIRLNDRSCGIKSGLMFLSFVTIQSFDGQTDRQTDRQNSHR